MDGLRPILEQLALKHFRLNALHGLDQTDIKANKLNNVKNLYKIIDEEIYFLYDSTILGSAKEGVVFTDSGLYWKEKLGDPEYMSYREIVESTANRNNLSNEIYIISNEASVKVNHKYFNFIGDLKVDLTQALPLYGKYYRDILLKLEQSLMELAQQVEFEKIISYMYKCNGLFLESKDKSFNLRAILFEAYLAEEEFYQAEEVLETIKEEKVEYYENAMKRLELAIKNKEYRELDERRLYAIEIEDFETAYSLLEEQRNLGIKQEEELTKTECEIKQAHFDSLDKGRLDSIEEEDFEIAYNTLYKQEELQVKSELEIDEIRKEMDQVKAELLEKYHEELKLLVDSEHFIEAEAKISQVQKIESDYPLEREKISLMIYQYKLDEANGVILEISDGKLKSELEEVYKLSLKTLYDEIRDAVRQKDYDFFKMFPDVWNYKDEYGMSALHYFALTANREGLMEAIGHTNHPFASPNIYGHDVLDLLGFACDNRLGNTKENALDILYSIRNVYNNQKVRDKIEYLATGNGKHYFYYNMSEEIINKLNEDEIIRLQQARLSKLNQQLMSPSHFAKVFDELENQINSNETISENHSDSHLENIKDLIIKQMILDELEKNQDYPVKGEFETREDYLKLCEAYVQDYLEDETLINGYKDKNQPLFDELGKMIDCKDCFFMPSLLTFVEYSDDSLKLLESLESEEGLLELFTLYFPIKSLSVEIASYDADREVFFMIVEGEIREMEVPLEYARSFKEGFDELNVTSRRYLEDDVIVDILIFEYEDQEFVLPFEKRRAFWKC